MPTAQGFIKSVGDGSKFTSVFIIDDIQYHFSGDFNPAVQVFEADVAKLEYDSVEDLTNTRDFSGKVGTKDVTLTLANGPKISGQLNQPISPASVVSGTGSWSQN